MMKKLYIKPYLFAEDLEAEEMIASTTTDVVTAPQDYDPKLPKPDVQPDPVEDSDGFAKGNTWFWDDDE